MRLIALLALAALCFAQERVQPAQMAQLRMLVGEWKVLGKGGKVEFHYEMTVGMVGRAKADAADRWRRMMSIYPKGDAVLADFYDVRGRVTRYRLDVAGGKSVSFVGDNPAERRRIVYTKEDPDHLSYLFESGGRVVDSGRLAMVAEVRPLSE